MSIVEYSGFWGNIPVDVMEIVDCQGHLADGNKNTEQLFVVDFLIIINELNKPKNYQI